jgi:sugar phosphate isomerase/epimerase
MYYTGFADEAANSLAGQIDATKALGWKWIEARKIDGVQIHDLSEDAFDRVCGQLADSGVGINCFGSAIANWQKQIHDSDTVSQAETARAIARMQRLGTKLVRIMSYAIRKGADGVPLDDQMDAERFRRLRELKRRFDDAGLMPVHENCMNYGGMGWPFTLRLLENVPGLKLVYDTGNPTHSDDMSAPKGADGRRPKQDSWQFYQRVREQIAYVHIKDGKIGPDGKHVHTWPGEGAGAVREVLTDLFARGYDGGISIEPHLAVVHHDASITSPEAIMRANYIEYGQRTMAIVAAVTRRQTA